MMIIKKLPVQWVLLLLVNITLGIALITQILSTNHEQAHITDQLIKIQSQLNNLEQGAKSPAEKVDLSSINQDVNRLTSLIGELKPKDDGQLNQLVIESRMQLADKLDAISTVITSLDKKHHPIKYLAVSALPFKIKVIIICS